MNALHKVTISIATKDRHEDLIATLRRISQFGMSDFPIVVLDDGSTPPLKERYLEAFPNSTLIRLPDAQGQARGRNQIALEAKTPYLLQLDDDSFPIEGSVEDAIKALEASPDRIALALPMEEPSRNRSVPECLIEKEIEVKSFVGCSALIDRDKFLKVGGYADWIGRTGEEEEFCIRSLRHGYRVLTSPSLRIRHMASSSGRSLDGIRERSVSNHMAIWIRYAPKFMAAKRILGVMAFALLVDVSHFRIGTIKNAVSAFLNPSHWRQRNPIKTETMKHYLQLDHVLDFYPKISQPK